MSGHKNYRYKVNNGSWIEETSVDIKNDGKTSVSFSACDQAENCSDSTSSKEVWIDTVNPTCDLDVRADGVKYNGDWTHKLRYSKLVRSSWRYTSSITAMSHAKFRLLLSMPPATSVFIQTWISTTSKRAQS